MDIHHYVRGSCIYGVMPANGLLYKPPDSCACHYQSKLTHFCALAPARATAPKPTPDTQRLTKGSAYTSAEKPPATPARPGDWLTYRGNAARSGNSTVALPDKLTTRWQAQLGGKLSATTAAEGKVYVAAIDRHMLYALEMDSGKILWTFTATGRIDSPPTLHRGMALFGSADGQVYCLRCSDGQLAWRYQAAPDSRALLCYQQFESLWPIHGSVLVHDDTVYCVAGRSMFFDGGMRLLRLNALTGEKLSVTVLNEIDPETGKHLQTKMPGKAMPVANPDVLSCDGTYVYMGAQKFDLKGKRVGIEAPKQKERVQSGPGRHLFCPTGFLDNAWFHRSYMMVGLTGGEGHGEYTVPPNLTPTGRLLVLDETNVYGFRASAYSNTMQPRPGHYLYATLRQTSATQADKPATRVKKKKGKLKLRWTAENVGLLAHAMVLAGKRLFIAGPPDVADEGKAFGVDMEADSEVTRALKAQDEAWRGAKGALLKAMSAENGEQIAEYKLDALPVWDGMAAAGGRLIISLQDGSVICFGAGKGSAGKP
jgi:hypothetical protein